MVVVVGPVQSKGQPDVPILWLCSHDLCCVRVCGNDYLRAPIRIVWFSAVGIVAIWKPHLADGWGVCMRWTQDWRAIHKFGNRHNS